MVPRRAVLRNLGLGVGAALFGRLRPSLAAIPGERRWTRATTNSFRDVCDPLMNNQAAYCGGALDPATGDMYLFTGGHAEPEGGNGIIRRRGNKYELFKESSPLGPDSHPIDGPATTHTYGGGSALIVGKKLLYMEIGPRYLPNGGLGNWGPQHWALDLNTRRWKRLADHTLDTDTFYRVHVGNGKCLAFGYRAPQIRFAIYDANADRWTPQVGGPWELISYGSCWYDGDATIWIRDDKGISRLTGVKSVLGGTLAVNFQKVSSAPAPGGSDVSPIGVDGFLYNISANGFVQRYEIATGKWHDWIGALPPVTPLPNGGAGPYNRVQLVGRDVIRVDLTMTDGAWDWKIDRDESHWKPSRFYEKVAAQSFVDKAAPGGDVTIPPGLYAGGLVVNKGLTLRLKGVVLVGVVMGKGNILVTTEDQVTIHDHECLGIGGDNGAAAVRTEAQAYKLKLVNPHYANCPNGILTGGNPRGVLEIEGGLIEKMTGGDDPASHGIYMSTGDLFSANGLTITGQGIRQSFGHLFKSRARRSVLKNCKAIGGDGHYSRLADFPCGGTVEIDTGCVFEHGPNATNPDCFAYATEPGGNCTASDGVDRCAVPGSFTFKGRLTTKRAGTRFGTCRGAPGTVLSIDTARLPAGLDMGTFKTGP
jgi:hypothetical protein